MPAYIGDWRIDSGPVAPTASRAETSAGLRLGVKERSRDAAPATWGAAMEVPDRLTKPLGRDAELAEGMLTPGAYMSTQRPWLEK